MCSACRNWATSYVLFSLAIWPSKPLLLDFAEPCDIQFVMLGEDIAQGQRVENFQLRALMENGTYATVYQGTTIGHKKICALPRTLKTKQLIVAVTAARDAVLLKDIKMY